MPKVTDKSLLATCIKDFLGLVIENNKKICRRCMKTMAISTNSDAFKLQKKLMKITGFWPHRQPTLLQKTYGIINYMMMTTFAGSSLLSAFVQENVQQMIQSLFCFICMFNICMKLAIFRCKMPAFLDLLDFLHSPHFTYYNDKFDPHLKRSIRVSMIVVKLLCSCSTIYVIIVFSEPLLDRRQKRKTPYPFPLDLKQQPVIVYLFVYVFQFAAVAVASFITCGFDNLPISMMGLSSGYFKILKYTIQRITDPHVLVKRNSSKEMLASYGNFDQAVNKELYKCVEHHLAVIKFTDAIENIFTYVFFSQFLSSAAGICMAIFSLQSAVLGSLDFVVSITALALLMFQITLFCTYGNEVTIQSSQIRDACYMTEWVYCGPSVRKTLFIMERSKRSVVFTAGKFIDLSLESLVNIVRSAASYAAILRQLVNK